MPVKIKTIFILFFLLFSVSAFAQPKEYSAILETFALPDKVISLEFSNDVDGLMSFNLEIQTDKNLQELVELFKNKFGLKTASIKYEQETMHWTFLLKAVETDLININDFLELMNQNWSTIPNGLAVLVNSSKKTVFCNYSEVKSLEQNMIIAQKLGMKISDSISHKNSSVAIFSKDLKSVDRLPAPIVGQNDEVAGYLKEYGDLVKRREQKGCVEYSLVMNFEKIIPLLSGMKQMNINIISLHLDAHPTKSELVLKLSEGYNDSNNLKISNLKTLLNPKSFPWVSQLDVLKQGLYVTGLGTGFDKKIAIHGLTSQSSLIFSRLFPLIKRFKFIEAPFFSRGTYSQYECGRMMKFKIDCSWY